jgi:hypothetical protein
MAIPMPADARLTINGRAVRRLPVGLPAGTQVLALNALGSTDPGSGGDSAR